MFKNTIAMLLVDNKEIRFACVRQLFYKINYLFVDVVEGEYFRPREYLVKCDPDNLKNLKQLH